MKITAGGQNEPVANFLLQFLSQLLALASSRRNIRLLECGVATTCVMPSAIADSAIASEVSMFSGPSSSPGRI